LAKANVPQPLQVDSPTGTDLWCNLFSTAKPESMIVRAGVAPKDVGNFVLVQSSALERGSYVIDIANGLVYVVTQDENIDAAKTWLESLRKPALAAGGYAAVMHMPDEWRGMIDRWGYQPDTLDLMRALKARWDPQNILGVGEFII